MAFLFLWIVQVAADSFTLDGLIDFKRLVSAPVFVLLLHVCDEVSVSDM